VATIIGISAAFVVNHQLTIGDLTVFVAYMVQLLKPVEKINELASAVSSGFSRAEMLFELFQQRPAVQDSPSATNVQLSRGLIEFKAVGFAYPGKAEDDSVLRGISFQLKPGQMTILSGASGSGKSTLINVLLKQLVPDTGVITLDGHNYSAMTTQSIRSRFAVLPQHHHLFSGRLSDSLWLNSKTIADSAIWEALAKVDMEAAIRQLPDGLNTVLTEDGLNFSGGQRARLCLARALLLERAILVLDEPLANIDTQSQLIIVDALMQIRKTTTCLIVSHQPVLYQQADQLLTLEHGRLVNNTIQDESRACANL
ncbi:MAG: ABC transporter ATP-binding protein/permease, partial [Gammaproteobacteria bacterium]|nr:ABC transporter ATP-binding protein/permease [Gammaproteobacteria bacterium]